MELNADEAIELIKKELESRRRRPVKTSRKERRESERIFNKYMPQVEKETEDDKMYFIENPSRNHRIRPTFPVEDTCFREMGMVTGKAVPKDATLIVFVKQMAPGARMRKAAHVNDCTEENLETFRSMNEAESRRMYDQS